MPESSEGGVTDTGKHTRHLLNKDQHQTHICTSRFSSAHLPLSCFLPASIFIVFSSPSSSSSPSDACPESESSDALTSFIRSSMAKGA